MCVSMSTQQIAIFGDKLVVRREELAWKVRDLVLHATVAVCVFDHARCLTFSLTSVSMWTGSCSSYTTAGCPVRIRIQDGYSNN